MQSQAATTVCLAPAHDAVAYARRQPETTLLYKTLQAHWLGCRVTIETEGGDPIGAVPWRPLLVIVAAIIVFGLSLERLGLLITVPLLIVISSFAGGEFGWKGVLVNAAVLTFGSWGIFVWGLKLTLPLWPRMFQ